VSFIVKGNDFHKINLSPETEIDEIMQNIAVLLATPKGSVPLDRDMGLPMAFLDKPVPVAEALLVAEVNEVVPLYEPRVVVVNTTFEFDADDPGRMVPIVEVEVVDE